MTKQNKTKNQAKANEYAAVKKKTTKDFSVWCQLKLVNGM